MQTQLKKSFFLRNRYSVVLFFSLTLSLAVRAQQINWAVYDTSNYAFNPAYPAVPITADANGNVYSSWLSEHGLIFGQQLFGTQVVSCFSSQGTTRFRHLLGPNAEVTAIQKLPNGETAIAGSFMDSLCLNGTSLLNVNSPALYTRNAFILYLDSTGDFLRARNLTLSYPDLEEPFVTTLDHSGNLWFAYFSWNSAYAVCLNTIGQDSVVRDVSGLQANLGDFVVDAAGALYFTGGIGSGTVNFGGLSVSITPSYNSFLAKMDVAGNGQWFTTIPDITFQFPRINVAGNEIYFSRPLFDSVTVGGFHLNGPQWVNDLLTVKYDTAGNIIWAHDIPDQPTITGDLSCTNGKYLTMDGSGGYYQLFEYRGQVDLGNTIIVGAPGTSTSRGASLVYFDGNGVPQSHLDIPGVNGLFPFSVVSLNPTDGFISGTARGGVQLGSTVVITPDPFDFISWTAKFSRTSTGLLEISDLTPRIFPNPSSGAILYFSKQLNPGIVTITDTQGKVIREISLDTPTDKLELGLSQGVYILSYESERLHFSQRLFVVR